MADEGKEGYFKKQEGVYNTLAAIFRGRAEEHMQKGDMKRTVLNWKNARLAAGVATLAGIVAKIVTDL
ncbi:MAG: hypothetical protein AAB955_01150 [Patescibacteria group bacterium]